MSQDGVARSVLGIDTAGPVIGAAIHGPGGELSWHQRISRGADTVLAGAVRDLLAQAASPQSGISPVGLVAVSVGPGTFTGLRVGVATALGLAMARAIPVVALSSLEVRARLSQADRVLSLLDARKGRVYAGSFERAGEELVSRGEWDRSLDEVLELARAQELLYDEAVGEGARVFAEQLEAAGIAVAPGADRSPALEVARLGEQRRHEAVEAGAIALRYLRPPDARLPAPR